jgi:RNA polymerase sigma-70 factor (ECF subfamily)
MQSTPPSLLEKLHNPADHQAWQEFVDLYTPLLYHWARRAGLQDQDAADLLQDVFTTLYQKLPEFQYDQHKSFRKWLRSVTLNQWRDNCKRRGRQPLGSNPDALNDVPASDGLDAAAEREYRQHLVGRALRLMQAEFQPTTWKACWEFVVRDRPAAEVARELGISENAVYIAKCRVVSRLRQELEGLMD